MSEKLDIEPIKTEAPEYDPNNPDHVLRWQAAGSPDLQEVDADGNRWRPTVNSLLQPDGSYAAIPAAPRDPDQKPAPSLEVRDYKQLDAALDAATTVAQVKAVFRAYLRRRAGL